MKATSPQTRYLVGVDEVGRGPLAGPLCVGAFLVPRARYRKLLLRLKGIKDSKQLTEAQRILWQAKFQRVRTEAGCRFSTVFVSERFIGREGLVAALRFAISRTLRRFRVNPRSCHVLLDGGIKAPSAFLFQETIIRGDESEPLIAAASIVAKVRRDRHMVRLGKQFPLYGFEVHKGYGTKAHYKALRRHDPCEVHRRSFLKKLT